MLNSNQNGHCSYMHRHILLTRLSGLDLTAQAISTKTTSQPSGSNTNLKLLAGAKKNDCAHDNPTTPTTNHRNKRMPSQTTRGALKVLADALKRGAINKTAVDIIQIEWFEISSLPKANPLDIEDYLDVFEEISYNLLEFVVNISDNTGNTAMHYAVSHGNFDIVSILLDSKVCDVNKANNAGFTCFMLVSLLEIPQSQVNVARRLFQSADVNLKAKHHGQTALMLASSHGNLNLVNLLLQAGADVNIQDDDGSTALMCAVENNQLEIVRCLINQSDCDLKIADSVGNTAAMIATKCGACAQIQDLFRMNEEK